MMFSSEKELESHLRGLVARNVTARYPHVYALDNQRIADIVICRDGKRPAVFFLEVKLFQEHSGRMGVGTGSGCGYKPELIHRTLSS